MNKLIGILVFIVLLSSHLSGCSSLPKGVTYAPDVSKNKKLLVDEYYIGVDDVVAVNVWKNPDISISVPVRPDGKISVPLIGEVVAGGKTPVQVSKEITRRLAKYIIDPKVSVILEQLNSHAYLSRVRVTGAVRTPISISFRQGMTVLDIVLEAGGLNEFASANSTKLFRKVDGKAQTIHIKLANILNDGEMLTNIAIQPGDIVSVPERVF